MKKSNNEHENELAKWLAATRIAKYRHDNKLPFMPRFEWFPVLQNKAKESGLPDMFKPSPRQLIELIASNGTQCNPAHN